MRLLAAASEAKPRAAPIKIRRAKTSRLNEYVYASYAAANLKFSPEIKFAFKIAKILRSNSPFRRNFKRETDLNAVRKISGKARRVARCGPEILSSFKDAREATSKI